MLKILVLLTVMCSVVFADDLHIRYPVGTPMALNTATSNILSTTWVRLGVTDYACSAMLLHNTGAQPLMLGSGLSGSELTMSTFVPIAVTGMIPIQVGKSVAISLKSLGSTQSSGIVSAACFQ